MHLDPALPEFVSVVLILAVLAVVARAVRQPYAVGYIIAGCVIGPSGLALVVDLEALTRAGAIGVLLLLFFVGMEVSPRALGARWAIAIFGTLMQVAITTGLVMAVGWAVGWSMQRGILVGFIVSLSSTAVVLKLLEDWKEVKSPAGQDVLSVLLAQDLLVIPMLIGVGFLAGEVLDVHTVRLQIVGGVLLIGLAVWVAFRDKISLPFGRFLRHDRELQVLAALVICFGLALISGLLELSSALGAFVAGMIIHAARETKWVDDGLHGFRVIFIAFFFVSVGMLIDLSYLGDNWLTILFLVFVAVVANTFINAAILRLFRRSWAQSLYAGALLSQIGEFSFVLASVGWHSGLISPMVYQTTISVIALSLILSPAWIGGVKWYIRTRLAPEPIAHAEAPAGIATEAWAKENLAAVEGGATASAASAPAPAEASAPVPAEKPKRSLLESMGLRRQKRQDV